MKSNSVPAPRTLVVLGASLETSNRGVSALCAATCSLLDEHCPVDEIVLLVAARDAPGTRRVLRKGGAIDVKVVCFSRGVGSGLGKSSVWALMCSLVIRLIPLRWIRTYVGRRLPIIASIDNALAVVDLFGGDSFSDIYGLRRFFFRAVPRWIALNLQIPYILLPQTYGPYKSQLARFIARSILGPAMMIFTRTRDDAALSSVRPMTMVQPRYCPDVAFSLIPSPAHALPSEYRREANARDRAAMIGINVNGLLYSGGYTRNNMFGMRLDYPRFLDLLLERLLADHTVKVRIVPHTYSTSNLSQVENDLGASLRAVRSWPSGDDRLTVLEQELDQHQLKAIIGGCDVFVGSRLHACIAALSQGVVTIGVGYSKKFVETFSTLGAADLVVDGRTFDTQQAVDRVMHLIQTRANYRDAIVTGAERNRQLLDETFASIARMLRPEGFLSPAHTPLPE